ncbi:hypothetical protein R1flu_024444 [Riccia fluitans]|uniref:Uncharacterized protein n=1 Tax=Riccia fluitans TaxID=41844 RepID=A0ABD1XUX1_9MARC
MAEEDNWFPDVPRGYFLLSTVDNAKLIRRLGVTTDGRIPSTVVHARFALEVSSEFIHMFRFYRLRSCWTGWKAAWAFGVAVYRGLTSNISQSCAVLLVLITSGCRLRYSEIPHLSQSGCILSFERSVGMPGSGTARGWMRLHGVPGAGFLSALHYSSLLKIVRGLSASSDNLR